MARPESSASASASEDEQKAKRRRRHGKEEDAIAVQEKSAGAAAYAAQTQLRKLAPVSPFLRGPRQRPRVYVGNLGPVVTEQEILQIFSAFGPVMGIDMPRDGVPLRTKGFCFVEFEHPFQASQAIASLQAFTLGGRLLRVSVPTLTSFPKNVAFQAKQTGAPSGLTLGPPGGAPSDAPVAGQAGSPASASGLHGPGNRPVPTTSKIVCLDNMVGPGEADEELAEEVGTECGKYGRVVKVKVHEIGTEKNVRVLVKFQECAEVSAAVAALNGRWFGGRQTRAFPYFKEGGAR